MFQQNEFFGLLLFLFLGIVGCGFPQSTSAPQDQNATQSSPFESVDSVLGVSSGQVPNEVLSRWFAGFDQEEIEKSKFIQNSVDIPIKLNTALKEKIIEEEISWIRLRGPDLSEDLRWLSSLGALRGLSIRYGKLVDADFNALKRLGDLEWLDVSGVNIGSNNLPSLPNLEVLVMATSLTSDENIPQASQFPNLKVISLAGSTVSNLGVQRLVEEFPNLRALDLSHVRSIDDNAVKQLVKLQKLKYLYLAGTRIGESQAELLSKKLNCFISFAN